MSNDNSKNFSKIDHKVPFSFTIASDIFRLKIKLYDYFTIAKACLSQSDYLIVGCYNTSNLGDIALGDALSQYFKSKDKTYSVVSYKALKVLRFLKFKNLVIGGGGVLTTHDSSPLKKNISLLNSINANIYLVGISGIITKNELSEDYMMFLKNCKSISVRSHESITVLKEIGVKSIYLHEDLVFLLDGVESQKEKLIIFNTFSPLVQVAKKRVYQDLIPSAWYKKHLPEESEVYKDIRIYQFRISKI